MKLPVPFIQLPLTFDAARLATEIAAIDASAWRPHTHGFPGNDALSLISVRGDPTIENVNGPMQPTPHLERMPYLRQVLASFGTVLGRCRLMRLSGHAEVTPHVDMDYYWRERVRVHVPIVTQPTVRFYCGSDETHMGVGECWIFDNWRRHRVVNDAVQSRVHLVADTVGTQSFWEIVGAGRPHDRPAPNWQPRHVPYDPAENPTLPMERLPLPKVMSPWELREHLAHLFGEAEPSPQLQRSGQATNQFVTTWRALWARYGEDDAGLPEYRDALQRYRAEIAELAAGLRLRNGALLIKTIESGVLKPAIAGQLQGDPETREMPAPAATTSATVSTHVAPAATPVAPDAIASATATVSTPSAPAIIEVTPTLARSTSVIAATSGAHRDPQFDRPVIVVCPPRSGSTLLFETLARAPGVYTIGGESHRLIEGLPALRPEAHDYASNRLDASDATPANVAEVRARFLAAARDRDGHPPSRLPLRLLEKTPKNSLRIPFLAQVFPEARFVSLYRDPREVLSSMIEAWESGRFRTYPQLPDWTGPTWSLVLVPGWRELSGRPLHEIVARQWAATTQVLLDDLAALSAERRVIARYDALLADPQAEIRRLCAALGLDWDTSLEGGLPIAKHTVSRPAGEKWRRHEREIERVSGDLQPLFERAAAFAAA